MRDPSNKYSQDQKSSSELLEIYRRGLQSGEDNWESMAILQYRGGNTEFVMGKQLTESDNPDDRCIGTDLLAQLG